MELFRCVTYTRRLLLGRSIRAEMCRANKKRHCLPLSSTMQGKDLHLQSSREAHVSSHMWKLLLASGGVAATLFWGLRTQAQCQSVEKNSLKEQSEKTVSSSSLPVITFYQYQTCPYCSKARAFLEYYGVQYEKVEVNPVFRREIKSFKYRKLPFLVTEGVQIGDSSLLVSLLRTCMVRGMSIPAALDLYPEMTVTDSKGKTQTERANKYFVMYGETGDVAGVSIDQRREEREWREWVDSKLVRTIPPNIYRTLSEAVQASDYVSSVGNFSAVERVGAKYLGAVAMYLLAKSLKKKYHLQPDVRESLYGYCRQWKKAIGPHQRFLGGDQPNLADLAVYGVLSAIEGLDTFRDVMAHTGIEPWYRAVREDVILHKGACRA